MATFFDYIIVGGGTAGVVIASRLSQYLPTARIALVEAGPNAVNHQRVNEVSDAFAWIELLGEGLVVDYSTTPQLHLDNRQLLNPAGHLLSGSSGVNVGTWMRASTADHDLIAQRAGHDRFLYKNMLKYYKRQETHFDTSADKEFHGFDGPIHTIGGRQYPMRGVMQESAEKIGHRYNPTAFKGDPIGLVDYVQCFRATSESVATRQHSAKVYDLSNVQLYCESPLARVLFDEEKCAIGVELVSGLILRAKKEVIPELSKYGIPVLQDSPAVGRNYSDHSAFTLYFRNNDGSKGYSKPFRGKEQPSYGQGMPIDFSCVAALPTDQLTPYLEADKQPLGDHPALLAKRCHFMSLIMYYSMFPHPVLYPGIASDTEGTYLSLASLHMQPLSRGTVTLKSADPKDHPVCDPKFFSTNTDRYIMRAAIRDNLRLAATSPLADEIGDEIAPVGFDALTVDSSDEEIDARVRAFTSTVAHPMGTCALGSVLDDEFRVKGVKGLRVCDASVFPEPIGAMPSCAIYALAEMCAELVAEGIEGRI